MSNERRGQTERSGSEPVRWLLTLYVAGQTPKCLSAISNLKEICEEHLPGQHEIQIIDLVDNPELASRDDVLALPTLVRRLPEPVRKMIGNLSDTQKVLIGLEIQDLVATGT